MILIFIFMQSRNVPAGTLTSSTASMRYSTFTAMVWTRESVCVSMLGSTILCPTLLDTGAKGKGGSKTMDGSTVVLGSNDCK